MSTFRFLLAGVSTNSGMEGHRRNHDQRNQK